MAGRSTLHHRGCDFYHRLCDQQAIRLILSRLRTENETGYKIPQGGLYRWISCPNYFGEIVIWTGWAIATWSLAGLSFAVWTVANLTPHAKSHKKWYQEQFADFPNRPQGTYPRCLVDRQQNKIRLSVQYVYKYLIGSQHAAGRKQVFIPVFQQQALPGHFVQTAL